MSPEYAQRVIRFFIKLFTMVDGHKEEAATLALSKQLAGLVEVLRPTLEGLVEIPCGGHWACSNQDPVMKKKPFSCGAPRPDGSDGWSCWGVEDILHSSQQLRSGFMWVRRMLWKVGE